MLGIGNSERQDWGADHDETDDLHWMPDSRHWFYWDSDSGRLVMHSLNSRTVVKIQPRGLPKPAPWGTSILGVTGSGQVIAMTGSLREVGATFVLYKFSAKPGAEAERIGTVTFPDNVVMSEVALNPRDNRLVWQLEANDTSARQKISLSTSDLDFRHRHEIGCIYEDEGSIDMANLWNMTELQWVPDGRRVSFVYKNTIWTAPAF